MNDSQQLQQHDEQAATDSTVATTTGAAVAASGGVVGTHYMIADSEHVYPNARTVIHIQVARPTPRGVYSCSYSDYSSGSGGFERRLQRHTRRQEFKTRDGEGTTTSASIEEHVECKCVTAWIIVL